MARRQRTTVPLHRPSKKRLSDLIDGRRRRKVLLTLSIAAAVLSMTLVALDAYGRREVPEGRWDAIIVTGCKVERDGTASPALRRRTLKAVELWRSGLAPVIVLTGGVGRFEPSEARAAADVAMEAGVPESALLLEELSTSTEENALFASRLIDSRRVIVVTDTYHVFRTERVFGRHFAEARAVGSVPRPKVRVLGALREVAAIADYALAGRL